MARPALRLFTLFALAFALPLAAAPTPVPVAGKQPAAPESNTVCTWEKPTGSNMAKKICTTAAQRDERRAHDQDALRQVQGTRAPPAQASPTGR